MKILLGLSAIILIATGIVSVKNYELPKEEIKKDVSQEQMANIENVEPKFIIEEISDSSYRYDLTDKEKIKEISDLVIIGNISEIKEVSNYIKKLDMYSATRTFTNVDNIQILYQNEESKNVIDLVSSDKLEGKSIPVVFYGGTLPYNEYEKSLRDVQKEKRASLLGIGDGVRTKENVYIKSKEKNQIEVEKNKKYLLYLVYDEDYEAFMPVSAEHGVMEYNASTKKVNNHLNGKMEKIDEII